MSQLFPDHLSSPRLRLRRLHGEDAAALVAYRSLPAVARYQAWESFGPDDALRLIAAQAGADPRSPGTWLQLAIVHAASGQMIGDCGLHCLADPRQTELGITLAPRQQGFGYADEAMACVLDYLFGTLDKHRICATIDVRNRAAIALCGRLGFRQEAHFVENIWFKGAWGGEYVFAMLQREWAERRRRG